MIPYAAPSSRMPGHPTFQRTAVSRITSTPEPYSQIRRSGMAGLSHTRGAEDPESISAMTGERRMRARRGRRFGWAPSSAMRTAFAGVEIKAAGTKFPSDRNPCEVKRNRCRVFRRPSPYGRSATFALVADAEGHEHPDQVQQDHRDERLLESYDDRRLRRHGARGDASRLRRTDDRQEDRQPDGSSEALGGVDESRGESFFARS